MFFYNNIDSMEISKTDKDRIAAYFRDIKQNGDLEFEVIVQQGKLNKHKFTSLLQYLRSTTQTGKSAFNEDQLSISFKHKNVPYRYEVSGPTAISYYCNTNSLDAVSSAALMQKSWVQGKPSILISDYDLKVNLKLEVPVESKDLSKEIRTSLFSLKKYYRYKRRFSFVSDDGFFRYDLTIVKASKNPDAFNLMGSGIFQSDDQYELEVEFLRPDSDDKWPSEAEFLKSLFDCSALVLRVSDGDDHLMPTSGKNRVVSNYIGLCGTHIVGNRRFVGPMPITLEKKNLLKPDLGVTSILSDYSVTDKADGERHLLYIDIDGKVYMINNRMTVRYTGVTNDAFKSSLLDGEYITRTRSGQAIKSYAAFDIYFYKGENVAVLPLKGDDADVECRLHKMNLVTSSSFTGDKSFDIKSKTFLFGDMIKSSKMLLEKFEVGNLPYQIDGLIYTPKSLPVGAIYKSSPVVLGGTWMKVFKWKPPEDNTIDFLMKTEKNSIGSDIIVEREGTDVKPVRLYVGYNTRTHEKITPHKYLMKQIKSVDANNSYQQRLFDPPNEIYQNISTAYIRVDDNGTMKAMSGDVIYDGQVVEMSYDAVAQQWMPLRVRKDKTSGNDYSTAVNIWRSINNPVTKDMITGAVELAIDASEAFDDDMYYNREQKRSNVASKAMLDFHNYWVKDVNMIAKFKNKASTVFDIACGNGNDLMKYINANIKTIVGVDKSEDNIINPNNGAYARCMDLYAKGKLRESDDVRFVYLPMDASKVLNHEYITTISDESTRNVAEVVWGVKSEQGLSKYHNMIANKFDLVVCQFAVHYFFENRVTLNAFVTNVASMIKDGGYFMGTCLDGREVNKKFKDAKTEKGESIQQRKDDRVLWDIRKMYDTLDSKSEKNYGLKIDVYIETINKRVSEYLVDFKLLEAELNKHDIHLLNPDECAELGVSKSTDTFKGLFTMLDAAPVNYFTTSAKTMTDAEKQYSFMNRWFIFKKGTAVVAPAPPKAKRVTKAKAKKAE